MAILDLLRRESLREFSDYAKKNGYVAVPVKDPIEVLRMVHKERHVLILRANKKSPNYYSVEELTADFVKEWAESRGTPYVQEVVGQTTLFDLVKI